MKVELRVFKNGVHSRDAELGVLAVLRTAKFFFLRVMKFRSTQYSVLLKLMKPGDCLYS